MKNKLSESNVIKEISVRSRSTGTKNAVIFAAVLFLITFFLQFVIETVLPAPENEIIDWKFICSDSAKKISGDIKVYNVANSNNSVSKPFGKNYIRLQYTLPESKSNRRLVIKTCYNPLRVDIDGKTAVDSGYGKYNFTGVCYNEVLIPNGTEKVLDIYVYAPLSFRFEAFVEDEEISVKESFTRYMGFGISIAITFIGIALFVLSILLAPKSKNLIRLIMLSSTAILGGMTGLLYSFAQVTSFLRNPFWFGIIMIMQFILIAFAYLTVLSCYNKALKNGVMLIPAIIMSLLILVFPSSWSVIVVSAVMTVAQFYVAIKANFDFEGAIQEEVPKVSTVRGLLIYTAICQLYNTACLLLGVNMLPSYLIFGSIAIMACTIFIVYCNQIIYLDIKHIEHSRQLNYDGVWIQDITSFISEMFLQSEETTFLIEAVKKLSNIIEKNAYLDNYTLNVDGCVGIKEDDEFTEIYKSTDLSNCDYKLVYGHLSSERDKILIGDKSVDMLFMTDNSAAVMHLENIQCGMTPALTNIIKSAFINLTTAYQNIKIKHNITDIQEQLFINIASIVEKRDKSTQEHQFVVSVLTRELCLVLGMDEQKADLISMASMTHDIGKIAISESILNKNGKLTDEEYEEMKKHTEFGYNILSLQTGEFFAEAAIIAQQHHENFDGSGYYGVKGRQIAPSARIVHLIDVVDALLSERSYKSAWSRTEVLDYIKENRGTMFAPTVVDAFLKFSDNLFDLREKVMTEETK